MLSRLAERTLVVADVVSCIPAIYRTACRVVRTPLDLIQALDDRFERIVLVGTFARDRCFAAFVRETCPSIDIVIASERPEHLASKRAAFA